MEIVSRSVGNCRLLSHLREDISIGGYDPHDLHVLVQNRKRGMDDPEVQLYQFCAMALRRTLDLVDITAFLIPS